MSHTLRESAQPTLDLDVKPLTGWLARLLGRVQTQRRLARQRKIVSELSDEQLSDAGIDRSAIVPPRPVIEVDAGLMAKLMSMR